MNVELRSAIAGRLKKARLAVHLTQEAASKMLKVHRQAISRWENGKTMPLSKEWFLIAPLYEVSLDYLVYGIHTMPVSRYGVSAPPQESRPAAAASDTPERLQAS